MDRMTKEQRSRTMSKIRSKKTGFEKGIFSEIRRFGVRFQSNYSGVIGKPDIALPKKRKVVFLHSDFWHGWQLSRWENRLPNDFWREKLRKNRARDKRVIVALRRQGWAVFVLWEHFYKRNPERAIARVVKFLRAAS